MSDTLIQTTAWVLGDDVNTDLNCSGKYLPGKDEAYIAAHAFEAVDPSFVQRFKPGDIIVAGTHFGINSSREQAVHVMHRMGVSAIIATSFGRQFYRNAINNGLPVIECDISGIVAGNALEIDLVAGRIAVTAKNITRAVPPLPATVRTLLEAGGLIPFLQKHPDWNVGGEAA